MEIEIDMREAGGGRRKEGDSGNSGISVTGMRRYLIAYKHKKMGAKWNIVLW